MPNFQFSLISANDVRKITLGEAMYPTLLLTSNFVVQDFTMVGFGVLFD